MSVHDHPVVQPGPPVFLDLDRYFQVMGFPSLLRRTARASFCVLYPIFINFVDGPVIFTVWDSFVWTGSHPSDAPSYYRLSLTLRCSLATSPLLFVFVVRRVVGFPFSFGLVWRLVGCFRAFVLLFPSFVISFTAGI